MLGDNDVEEIKQSHAGPGNFCFHPACSPYGEGWPCTFIDEELTETPTAQAFGLDPKRSPV